ncbi:MAG: MFS transporter [Anaerolineae bacterium]
MSPDSPVQKHLRRNYTLGVMNGALFGFVDAISAPSLVLALFVSQLGGSNLLIGLLPAIYNGGWFLPQLFVAHRLDRLAVKKGMYVTTALIRILCWIIIVGVTFWIGAGNRTLLLALFFAAYVTYSFMAGFAGNAFMTMVAKMIPSNRRGSFFGYRDLTGTGAGILAGYLISLALASNNGLGFPYNFGVLFIITWTAVTVGLTLFMFTIEPHEKVTGDGVTLLQTLRAARRIWGENAKFRRYLLTRIVVALADLATPFYAIYATRMLKADESVVGLYIGLTTLAAMLSNPAWSWITDHYGARPLMLSAAAGWLLMPLIALAFWLIGVGPVLITPFGLLFVVYGAARTAANISFPTYLLEIAPPAERSLHIGLTNTLLGVATFIPAGGGILLDWFGFMPLFVLSALIAALGVWLATGLVEARR